MEESKKGGRQSDKLQKALVAFINSLFFFCLVSLLTHLLGSFIFVGRGGGYIQFLSLKNDYETR